MKHAVLRAIGRNLIDSLVSGWSGALEPTLGSHFVETALSSGHPIKIDFLNGTVLEGKGSDQLDSCLATIKVNLPKFCRQNDAHVSNFRALLAAFEPLHVGCHVSLTVEGHDRVRSTTEYAGYPLRRVQVLDGLGRRRPKPALVVKP